MEDDWHTHSMNTAECFEHRGFFTIVLNERVSVFVPRCRGAAHVGNIIRVPQGGVKKPLQPFFLITVAGGDAFKLPEEAVREIRDADGALICVLRWEKNVFCRHDSSRGGIFLRVVEKSPCPVDNMDMSEGEQQNPFLEVHSHTVPSHHTSALDKGSEDPRAAKNASRLEQGVGVKRPEYFFWGAFVLAGMLFLFPREGAKVIPAGQVAAAVHIAAASSYQALSLEAKAAVVLDGRTKTVLFEKNARRALPLASLTKIMTAVTALSLVPETTVVLIDEEALREEGDTGLLLGDTWLLRDLLQVTLLESSNDGAHAIAKTVGRAALGSDSPDEGLSFFIEQMNRAARTLSLPTLSFRNETGLDISSGVAGGYGSARDAALLFARSLTEHPAIFEPTRWKTALFTENGRGGELDAHNTNRETERFPLLIASKTGYTDLAGGNLALAFDAGFNRPIIVVILGSTFEGRFADAEKLVWSTLEYLQSN